MPSSETSTFPKRSFGNKNICVSIGKVSVEILLLGMQLDRMEFEKIVKEGIEAVPEKFLWKLDNVAIVH